MSDVPGLHELKKPFSVTGFSIILVARLHFGTSVECLHE